MENQNVPPPPPPSFTPPPPPQQPAGNNAPKGHPVLKFFLILTGVLVIGAVAVVGLIIFLFMKYYPTVSKNIPSIVEQAKDLSSQDGVVSVISDECGGALAQPIPGDQTTSSYENNALGLSLSYPSEYKVYDSTGADGKLSQSFLIPAGGGDSEVTTKMVGLGWYLSVNEEECGGTNFNLIPGVSMNKINVNGVDGFRFKIKIPLDSNGTSGQNDTNEAEGETICLQYGKDSYKFTLGGPSLYSSKVLCDMERSVSTVKFTK